MQGCPSGVGITHDASMGVVVEWDAGAPWRAGGEERADTQVRPYGGG